MNGACPACRSTLAVVLGYLGTLLWVRCRQCGMDRQVPAEDAPPVACVGCGE